MTSSVIRLICPNLRCRSILAVPGSARGKMVRCRKCATRVQVPAPAEAAQPRPETAGPPTTSS